MRSKVHKESFVRWQGIAITQLGYAANLILGFATASLGFSLTLLKDKDFVPQGRGKWLFSLSLGALLLSIVFGIWCVINRLRDFRETTQIARDREQLSDAELQQRRDDVDKLGKCTWLLFWIQLASFAAGLIALVVVFATLYCDKLF
jgi:hypothetical protein